MTTLAELPTPAAVVDLDRMEANLDRMAAYVAQHGFGLRPHTKTHKSPERAGDQLRRGAIGVTVATPREAEVIGAAADDVLIAYPPFGAERLATALEQAERRRVTIALDSAESLETLAHAAAAAGVEVGVLVEMDFGMGRCGVADVDAAIRLARMAAERDGVRYAGIMFYPGHIRERVDEQEPALETLNMELSAALHALGEAELTPEIVSGGSTPTAFLSHHIDGMTEIRPGTYIYNDRTTAQIGACEREDCALTVLATVVSTAVPGQAVVDAGTKALSSELLRAEGAGYGELVEHPEVTVVRKSEEHGVLDLSRSEWRPRVGERVRILPNHVCVTVNLHETCYGVRGETVETSWTVAARGWTRTT